MWNVAYEGKPCRTRGKITEGSLSKPDYEPEDKANEGNHNKGLHHGSLLLASRIRVKTEVSGATTETMVVSNRAMTVRNLCALKLETPSLNGPSHGNQRKSERALQAPCGRRDGVTTSPIAGSRCGATSDEDVMTAYTHTHSNRKVRNTKPNPIFPLAVDFVDLARVKA
jgi:hypothetical protein